MPLTRRCTFASSREKYPSGYRDKHTRALQANSLLGSFINRVTPRLRSTSFWTLIVSDVGPSMVRTTLA